MKRNCLAAAMGGFVVTVLACVFLCSCDSANSSATRLKAALHTRPGGHRVFDADKIDKAIQEFGGHREDAFAILKKAANETNMLVGAGRPMDTNRFVRHGALYGMGRLGKSVPEVTPFLWDVIYSPFRSVSDRFMAFSALKTSGFQTGDIPTLAKLLAARESDHNILTKLVPEAISELVEGNALAAKPYLSSVESLLDDSNPDTQFRAALALVKSESAGNPKIFSALHALFQRPNNRHEEYNKMLAAEVLGAAGSLAQALAPDLLDFAKSASEPDVRKSVYDSIAKMDPSLSVQSPDVAQALKRQQDADMWSAKWKSGSYTVDDLRTALDDPLQTLNAANRLAQMGAAAKVAVPDMIRALWGKDEDGRNEILADIHKIDPQVSVIKINMNEQRIDTALVSARSDLDKMPASQQNKALADACFEMEIMGGWILPEELTAFTNNLAAQAPSAYQAFLEGMKPPVCAKPAPQSPY